MACESSPTTGQKQEQGARKGGSSALQAESSHLSSAAVPLKSAKAQLPGMANLVAAAPFQHTYAAGSNIPASKGRE
jgi:hypothetical protein